ncbi:MAG: hypothetical protein WA398_06200 [Nitrososphaeraceae archaeon]
MDETTQSEVEKILRQYEDNIKEQARKWEETKQNAENFREEYYLVKEEVIRPTMEEVGSYIKKLGHNYRIEDFEKKERISMIIIPNSMNGFNLDEPTISFEGWSTEVNISKRPLVNSSESSRRAKIEDITKSFVEQNILDIMRYWEKSFSS